MQKQLSKGSHGAAKWRRRLERRLVRTAQAQAPPMRFPGRGHCAERAGGPARARVLEERDGFQRGRQPKRVGHCGAGIRSQAPRSAIPVARAAGSALPPGASPQRLSRRYRAHRSLAHQRAASGAHGAHGRHAQGLAAAEGGGLGGHGGGADGSGDHGGWRYSDRVDGRGMRPMARQGPGMTAGGSGGACSAPAWHYAD